MVAFSKQCVCQDISRSSSHADSTPANACPHVIRERTRRCVDARLTPECLRFDLYVEWNPRRRVGIERVAASWRLARSLLALRRSPEDERHV